MNTVSNWNFPVFRTREDQENLRKAHDIIRRIQEDSMILLEAPELFTEQDIQTVIFSAFITQYRQLSYQEIFGAKYLINRFLELLPERYTLPDSGFHYDKWEVLMEADLALIRSIARKESEHPKCRNATYELSRRCYWEVADSPRYSMHEGRFAYYAFYRIWPILAEFHKEQSIPFLETVS